jgi:hypothetical protein
MAKFERGSSQSEVDWRSMTDDDNGSRARFNFRIENNGDPTTGVVELNELRDDGFDAERLSRDATDDELRQGAQHGLGVRIG